MTFSIRLALLFLALPLTVQAGPGKRTSSHQALRTQCLLHAADPKNPWALAHGVTAFGATFAASDGRRAADVMTHDFLVEGKEKEAGRWGFRRYAEDGTPVEPHTNLLTRALVRAGMKDREVLSAKGKEKLRLGDLVKSVKASFRHVPTNADYWEDVGWTLDLLGARLTPKKAKFQNGAGQTVDFNEVMDDALLYLEYAQKELGQGLDKGLAVVPKRKQGIYAHACGGLHFFQAVAQWARHPQVRKRWGKRLDRQVDILFYRLGSEQRQYEEAYQKAPGYRLQLLTQMLKFYGHFLETTGRLRKELAFKPDPAQRRAINKAVALLDWTTKELKALGAFDKLEEVRKAHPQIALDLVGDSCHAANGLDLWR